MKNIFKYILVFLVAFSFQNCSSSSKVYATPEKLQTLLNSENFTFVAEKANPTGMDVIKVMNSISPAGSSQVLDLSPGYFVKFSNGEMNVDLPYFGRMYVTNFDPNKNGFDFTSKKFTIDKSKSTQKKTLWVINVNDNQSIGQIYLEITKTGKAYISISSTDRQAISYDGYITENEVNENNL
ncbi:MAG: DUF4251 domain-containing protein [Flavobacteriaceae bacterium]|jgi:hypothetical protein|nr:DUF4251 domain-containing protein [Flavobacteriaceae bacterium]